MSWRDKITRLLMGKAPEVAAPAMQAVDPRVISRLQLERAKGGLVVGDEAPMGWAANTNIYRPPADVLPFTAPAEELLR